MTLQMTDEEKAAGMANFNSTAEELTRRKFMQSLVATGGVIIPVSAAVYFGYDRGSDGVKKKPVKAALIGGGDEGGVLVGEHNPGFLEIVAVCDIRPSNMERIFDGEKDDEKRPKKPRLGLK